MIGFFDRHVRLTCKVRRTRYTLFLYFSLSLLKRRGGWLSVHHWASTDGNVSAARLSRLTVLGLSIVLTTVTTCKDN